ncbi:MAG: hypothetical protein WC683_06070 [bacterium]
MPGTHDCDWQTFVDKGIYAADADVGKVLIDVCVICGRLRLRMCEGRRDPDEKMKLKWGEDREWFFEPLRDLKSIQVYSERGEPSENDDHT